MLAHALLAKSAAPKRRHRADYASPVPPHLRLLRDPLGDPDTEHARWISALVARFGDDIEHWGHITVVRLGRDLARIEVNARVKAFPASKLVLHAARTRWGVQKHEHFWTVYRDASRCARWIRGGTRIACVPTLAEVEIVAGETAPVLPPPGSGWTLAEWRAARTSGRPGPT